MPLQRTPTSSVSDNVTLRRHRTKTNDSLDLSFGSTQSEIERHSSLDLDLELDLSTRYRCDIEDLKKEILQLKNELANANAEIKQLKENILQKYNEQSVCPESNVSTKKQKVKNKTKKRSSKNLRSSSSPFDEKVNTSFSDDSATGGDSIIEPNKTASNQGDTTLCALTTDDATVFEPTGLGIGRDSPVLHKIATDGTTNRTEGKSQSKKKVVIIGDGQGRKVRDALANLLGSKFNVTCFMKPGAKTSEILNPEIGEVKYLSSKDFVIILAGRNDTNPYDFEITLNTFIQCVVKSTDANIVIPEIPYNKNLNEYKLNYLLRHICNNQRNVTYVDMAYYRFKPRFNQFKINLCRSLMRELLRLETNFNTFDCNAIKNSCTKKTLDSKSTQTDLPMPENIINHSLNTCISNQITLNSMPKNFFRE